MPFDEHQQINDFFGKRFAKNIKNLNQSNEEETLCDCAKKKTVYIMVGLPRSGKSTYAEKYKGNKAIISADQLRYLVYGQRFWGPGEDMMWAIRKIALTMLMEQGIDIVIDETNTTEARRKSIIELARKHNYIIEVVVINTPKEICIERARAEGDEKIIPVIERMAEQLEPISLAEVDYIYKISLGNPISGLLMPEG